MALNPSNSSNLEQLAVKGLIELHDAQNDNFTVSNGCHPGPLQDDH